MPSAERMTAITDETPRKPARLMQATRRGGRHCTAEPASLRPGTAAESNRPMQVRPSPMHLEFKAVSNWRNAMKRRSGTVGVAQRLRGQLSVEPAVLRGKAAEMAEAEPLRDLGNRLMPLCL